MDSYKDKLTFEWDGRIITARLDIQPPHFGPGTYTVLSNKDSQLFVFRKIEGVWTQAYGSKDYKGLKEAIIKALDERFEE